MQTEDSLVTLNRWWTSGAIPETLARGYRRRVFPEVHRLFTSHRQVLLLTGLRRVGKSTIVYQLISDLLKEEDPRSLLYYTFDAGAADIVAILDAYTKVTGRDWRNEKLFLFLDEIQKLDGWSGQLKMLYDSFANLRMVVSGSASLRLHKEALDNLAGRHFSLDVPPLSIVEFYELKHGEKVDRAELYGSRIGSELDRYLRRPFPEIVGWEEERDVREYVREQVVSKVVRGDIPDTFSKANHALLEGLLSVFYSRPGMILSVDSLAKEFRVSKTTLENHLFFLEFSMLIRLVRNFRPSRMSESRKLKKVYPYCLALALSYNNLEKGMVYESAVADLLNAKNYWRAGGREVDFILREPLRAVEVKSGDRVDPHDLDGVARFVEKFAAKGLVVYAGPAGELGRIALVPLTEFLVRPAV